MQPQDSKTATPVERTDTVRLSSEVKDAFIIDNTYTVAWIHGSLKDFCWYSPNRPPTDWLILKLGTDYYSISSGDIPATFAKLKAAGSDWHAIFADLNVATLYLPIPLAIGKRFSDDASGAANLVRQFYCWEVESADPFDDPTLKGLPHFHGIKYSMSHRTNPDYMEMSFVPGIGLVGLTYHHNGTKMEAEAKLVEFDHLD